MELHAETWGHVALLEPATLAMEAAEEQNEILMLRCRHKRFLNARIAICFLLHKSLPLTKELICNPGTHQDLAALFRLN